MNQYSLWKYAIVLLALITAIIFSLPNLYAPDPAVQISGESSSLVIDKEAYDIASDSLQQADIAVKQIAIVDDKLEIRLLSRTDQLPAKKILQNALGRDNYIVALNLAPTTPDWLKSVGAGPLKLGLDLSGGVHFLMEVDTLAAIDTRLRSSVSSYKALLRKEKVRGIVQINDNVVTGKFKTEVLRDKASSLAFKSMPEMTRNKYQRDGAFYLSLELGEQAIANLEDEAVGQNLITLRNRVNELGVSEPLVQRQGRNRVVVELPGVQDTATAKRILGKTANLEFRLAVNGDTSSFNREMIAFEGSTVEIERDIIVTGESVAGAQFGFDENSRPQVNINLDAEGGKLMHRITRHAVQRKMAVLFIERKTRKIGSQLSDDNELEAVYERYDQRRVISLATIQSPLGANFRITGLDSQAEAAELALLLRAGALAAPMEFVEERTIGPSLGAENIALGVKSVVIGFSLVLFFMLVFYRVFGLAANIALTMNLLLIVAVMSMLSATLTLPGIAGIVLTVGMAVDANVLIFSRIREELANGLTPAMAINTGFERAFLTILDANLTTLLAAVILYAVGTGPIKGFAITLSIGILTSMFTAIMGTRSMINLIYGGRSIKKLAL
ncbi:MAG: protein translocase subunit SecD [Cellvibrionales bacterium]|nr:protein translocase subunit SecD [Cellvibrionales bacterium]|tara:strand:+ start:6184 stop:8028 length:1845 start_codon:yes stop_codon:yes gene_type:complete